MHSEENNEVFDKSPAEGSSNNETYGTYETGHVSKLRRRMPRFSWEVRQEESSFATTARASNADFDPIPPSKRTWNWGAYVA